MITWYSIEKDDLKSINKIAAKLHPKLPERPEIFKEKMELFPQGCKKLLLDDRIVGYGLSHPWNLNSIPLLDSFLSKLPEKPDCLFIHDVAILPEARGRYAATSFISHIIMLAKQSHIESLSLVSVYMTTSFWTRFGFRTVNNFRPIEQLKKYGNTASYMTLSLSDHRYSAEYPSSE